MVYIRSLYFKLNIGPVTTHLDYLIVICNIYLLIYSTQIIWLLVILLTRWLQYSDYLIVVCGDHGMADQGGHGGVTPNELNVPLVFISDRFTNTHTQGMCVFIFC